KKSIVERQDAAVTVDGGADMVALLARMIGGDQMLAAILNPLDGPVQPQRRKAYQHVFRIKLAPDPKPAAHVALMKVHRGRGAAQHAGDVIAVPVRHLGGAIHFEDIAGSIVTRDGASGLNRRPGMTADIEAKLDDGVRVAKRALDVAVMFLNDC